VGCGDAALAVALAQRGALVTGVDVDPHMLAAGRARAVDAQTWLKAHPRRAARVVVVDVPEPAPSPTCRTPATAGSSSTVPNSTPLACRPSPDPATSWATALRSRRTVTMPGFLRRLDECGTPYRLHERHTNGDAHVRHWACNVGPAAPAS
jgi:SAM-dependent methyltransferase